VIQAKKGQAALPARLRQGYLLGRAAVAQQAVASDDERRRAGFGQMQAPAQAQAVRPEFELLDRWFPGDGPHIFLAMILLAVPSPFF
jgi:hypothetical protein